MAYQAYVVTRADTGVPVGSVEAQGPEEAVFRLLGGAWGREDFRAWAGADRPLASPGLQSYRYRGPYGWRMIGAKDDADALASARHSAPPGQGADPARLERWTPAGYAPVAP